MDRFQQPHLLLWLTAVLAMGANALAGKEDRLVMNALKLVVIPHNYNKTSVTKLMFEDNLITLNEEDRKALATYGTLEELRLDGNLVTAIPAKYFSVVPNLRVLSLSRNNITSLDPEAFFGLNVLTELDLSQNQLTSFPPGLLKGLNSLKVLKLQKNPWNCSYPTLITIQEHKQGNAEIGGPELTSASPENHTTLLPSQNNSTSKAQTPVLGNTWKFTACVGALALTTLMLITLAFKGPSWYKLYYNYRHRRLHQERDEGKDVASTGSSTRYLRHQTFMFKQGNGQVEEEGEDWDEYFEDPYVKKEELKAGEENLQEP